MPGAVGRGCGIVLAVGLLAGPAAAQLPSVPLPPVQQPTAGPGSIAWPGLASPTVPPSPYPPPAVTVLDVPRSAATLPPGPPPVGNRPVDLMPLPGSLEEDLSVEYAARQSFRLCTWRGTTIEAFPTSLLWEPPFAAKREPRMLLLPTSLDNVNQSWTLDTSIGGVFGLWRARPRGSDLAIQFDIGAVVHTRLGPEDLLAVDYRFAFPLSFARGPWHAKLAYEHTSAHLGDEFIRDGILRTGLVPPIPSWAKDEVVVGLGRWFADRVRVYGQVSYAFFQDLPVEADGKWRFDVGFEWFCPQPTGWRGTPFVAFNLDSRGDQAYQPNVNVQAGWLWRNPFQRLANVRLFAEYYNGRSPYGQFYRDREDFYAVGFSGDY